MASKQVPSDANSPLQQHAANLQAEFDPKDKTTPILVHWANSKARIEAKINILVQVDRKQCEERDKKAIVPLMDPLIAEMSSREDTQKVAQDEERRDKNIMNELRRFTQYWHMLIYSANDDKAKKVVEKGLEEIIGLAKGFIELQKALTKLQKEQLDVQGHAHMQRLQGQKHAHWTRLLDQQEADLAWLAQQPRETNPMMLKPLHQKQFKNGSFPKICVELSQGFHEIVAAMKRFQAMPMREQVQKSASGELAKQIQGLLNQDAKNVDQRIANKEKDFQSQLRRDHEEALSTINYWRCIG